MSYTTVAKRKRLRGVILKLLCTNHDEQQSRMDSTAIWSALFRSLGFDASQDEVMTCLQDLEARGYIKYQQKRNNKTGEIWIAQIELCPKGRDLLEETIVDPAVEI